MTKKKVLKIIAAIGAISAVVFGSYLLVKNDVAQKINLDDLKIYAPNIAEEESLDSAANHDEKPSADRLPEDTKKDLTNKVRTFQNSCENSVGWLYIPGTNINYPIMQASDNDYYLHRATDGSYLYAGSLFMDCKNGGDFGDFRSIIYGHNMKNGTMFAELPNYLGEEYFKNHSFGWLTTGNNVQLVDFFAVANIKDTSPLYDLNLSAGKWENLLRQESEIYKEVDFSEDDNLIMLSTCTYSQGDDRTILVGKIENERGNVNEKQN